MKIVLKCPGDSTKSRLEKPNGEVLPLVQEVTFSLTTERQRSRLIVKRGYVKDSADDCKVRTFSADDCKVRTFDTFEIDGVAVEITFELPDHLVEKFGRIRQSVAED